MNTLLVYPYFNYVGKSGLFPPLGIIYIASIIRQAGYRLKFVDLTFEKTLEKIAKEAIDSDLIVMSATTPLFGRALSVLNFAKKINPSLTAIIGGPHATVDPLQVLRDGFDIAVVGEGEETIAELLEALDKRQSLEYVLGIAFKKDGKFVQTSPRPPIEDLDKIPFPARDLLSPLYNGPVNVIVGRGCPYNCKFCQPMQRKLFGPKIRMRSVENVIKEIEILIDIYPRRIGRHGISFMDDIFPINKSWVYSFCQKLRERNLKVKWFCNSRVNLADEQMFKEMQKAGCIAVCFGVESGSQKILDWLGKGITVEQTKNAFNICHKLGLHTFAYLMIGTPGETKQDLEETVNLIKEINPTGIAIARTTPTPGSYLYENTKEAGTLNISDYSEFDYYSYAKYPIKLEYLSAKDLTFFENELKKIQLCNLPFWQLFVQAIRHPWKIPSRFMRLLKYRKV